MASEQESFIQSLNNLSLSVGEAVNIFPSLPEDLTAEGQTAKEVLSHLVFWHREYVTILGDLLEGRRLVLRAGKFRELNELAYNEFQDRPMDELADLFSSYQVRLEALLSRISDPSLRMPVKQGGSAWSVTDLVERVAAHIRGHLHRLKIAQRSFVKAQ